ncbi:P-type conjugative transfer protein TrbG [Legionella fairfieldensis]|uniref:P-type conjugative transfer protein TrbG n=1 Tax=Legionella fairfieldensis TaxID=45064 RepID=UPI00048C3612|nr:P-type conjugative transfer protein TrbG [Legionella fairfieldensis]
MKKMMTLLLMIPIISWATTNEELGDQYFFKNNLRLTPQEKAALSIGKKWQTGKNTSKPVVGHNGSIRFIYGSGQTQIMCAVLQTCDVALQPGEQVNNVRVGDPRFEVEPAVAGIGPTQQIHLLIEPKDVALDTTLVVTTDRRAYHFRLRSSRKEFMPYVSFSYPEEAQAKWNAIRLKTQQERIEKTIPQTGEYLGDLNFNYKVIGSARWKPCRVYNDGVKTIIEMPRAMQQTEAPTLLVVRSRGLFRTSETVMVNYRVQGNRYIVDSVFDKAIMIAGVGSSQNKVTIWRRA